MASAVESCRHESESELDVGVVVWSSYDAEVKLLVLLVFVGVVEVVEELVEPRLLLHHRVGGDAVRLCHGHHGAHQKDDDIYYFLFNLHCDIFY